MKYRRCAHDEGIRILCVTQDFIGDPISISKEQKGGPYEEFKSTVSERRSSNVSKNHIGGYVCRYPSI